MVKGCLFRTTWLAGMRTALMRKAFPMRMACPVVAGILGVRELMAVVGSRLQWIRGRHLEMGYDLCAVSPLGLRRYHPSPGEGDGRFGAQFRHPGLNQAASRTQRCCWRNHQAASVYSWFRNVFAAALALGWGKGTFVFVGNMGHGPTRLRRTRTHENTESGNGV